MPLKPLRCERCGSTRLSYLKVGVDDEVAVCGMCHGVTEYSEDVTEERANEELVLQLEQLRHKRPVLEEGGQYEAPKRKGGSSVLMWLMVAVAALGGLALLLGRDALVSSATSSDRLAPDRMMLEDAQPPPARGGRGEPAEAEEPAPAEDRVQVVEPAVVEEPAERSVE